MASIRLKMYRKNPRADGRCGIYLQVIINRKKLDLGLDLQWVSKRFRENGGCLPITRSEDDKKLCDDYNSIINKARAKANDVVMFYRLRDLPIDIDIFKREYSSNLNKNNFIEFYSQKSFERWNKGMINDLTYKQEKVTLNKLKEYQKVIPFNSFHSQWGHEFDLWLQKEPRKNDQNTRWAERKRIKTYLALATSQGIAFIDPYSKFKISQKKSRFKALSQDEFQKLVEYYLGKKILDDEKIILRRFLFSCCTGLRISDQRSLTPDNFKNGMMSFKPKKTKRHGTIVDAVPLNDFAIALLSEEIAAAGGRLFYKFTEQFGNRKLKVIATSAGLDHALNNHIGRSTFASLYDQAGGNHRSLMEYMGLTKMETLMKYVQTNKDVIKEGIDKMNLMIKH